MNYIEQSWPSSPGRLQGELRRLYTVRDRLTVNNGLVYYGSRMYIPKVLRAEYLDRCHTGHQGVGKCRRRAQAHFWWPGLSKDIADYVGRCNTCIIHGDIKQLPMVEYELPSRPWEVLGADLFVFREELYLVVIDYYSKWIEAVRVQSQTSAAVISVFSDIFSRFRVPTAIRSDNGGCFIGEQFRQFGKSNDIKLVTSSPRYPQSNGLAESAVKTVKRLWAKCEDKASALSAYRTAPLPSGYSPSELMFGRSVRTEVGVSREFYVDYEEFESRERERLDKVKREWDTKYVRRELPALLPGQQVYVKAPTYVGSYGVVVREDVSPHSYWVKVKDSEVRRNRKHLYLLHTDNFAGTSGAPSPDSAEGVQGNSEEIVLTGEESAGTEQEVVGEPPPEPVEEVAVPADTVGDQVASEEARESSPAPYVTRSGRRVKSTRHSSYVYK